MQVKVQLEGHLREYFPQLAAPLVLELPGPATVAEILQAAGLPAELPSAVIIDGCRVERDFVPAPGAELILLSPMAGG